jgi:hypothetical protein
VTGRKPKLTPAQVEHARRHHAQGITSDAIAKVYGVAGSTIRRYLRGESVHHRRAAT